MIRYIWIIALIIPLMGCSDSSVEPEEFENLNVDIRMEVQILDSEYQLYSRPFTEIYFTTYKLGRDNNRYNIDRSDTTSCRNGWGVKLLNFTFTNAEEKIILGASCENYEGENYREVEISYKEASFRIDSTNHASMVKTFAIYYD